MQNLRSFKHLCILLKYKNKKHNQKIVSPLSVSITTTTHTITLWSETDKFEQYKTLYSYPSSSQVTLEDLFKKHSGFKQYLA